MTRSRRKRLRLHVLWGATTCGALAFGLPSGEAIANPAAGVAAGCSCGVVLFVLLARRRPRFPGGSGAVRSANLGLRAAHEEALWRGGLPLLLVPLVGGGTAIAAGIVAFALAHAPTQGVRAAVHLLTGGAFSALALGPGLPAAMAAHASYNVLIGAASRPQHRPFRTVPKADNRAYARPTAANHQPSGDRDGQALLRLDDVVRRFGAVVALDGITLALHPGELVALLGPNGAGKSTAISIAVGARSPDSGDALLFGLDPRLAHARAAIGVAPQETSFPPTARVRELVGLVRSHFPAPAQTEHLFAEFGLTRVANRLAGGLSGGERRRLALALAFAGRPKLLVLDEPSGGLDVEARRAAWTSIRAFRDNGGAVLLTTHHLEEAEALADRIVVLDCGRIRAEGTARELRSRSGLARVTLRAAELPTLPQSTRVERSNDLYVLHTPEPEALVALLVASGVPFDGLEVAQPSLEEAFLELTGASP